MSTHGFRSVLMVASVAGAALGCYLVSLNVASERAELERVESQIVAVERDIRLLQTEIGTRGRLAQLERWNTRVIRLSAPSADQFVEGGFQLASLVRPQSKPAIDAPVIYAAAPADGDLPLPVVAGGGAAPAGKQSADPAGKLLHTASYTRPESRKPGSPVSSAVATESPPRLAPARKMETANGARSAAADPLSPLPGAGSAASGTAPQPSSAASKDTSPAR